MSIKHVKSTWKIRSDSVPLNSISSVKGWGYSSLECLQITKSALCNFATIQMLPFLNILKDLDPSYKMDLDFWIVLEEK